MDATYGAAYSQLAKLYYSAGDLDKASQAISQALERDAYQPDFLYVQGKILEKQGKLDEALAAFQRSTIVNPKESDAFFEMGAIYEQRGDKEMRSLRIRKPWRFHRTIRITNARCRTFPAMPHSGERMAELLVIAVEPGGS